ncbi:MAG: DUF4350 domain-containing protein [Anaerolineae bacterium]|nr:DUF4350 domain-containing protein [Anaerolineae bacterium]
MNANNKPKMGIGAKLLFAVLIVIVLAGLTCIGRLAWFRRGLYQTPDIAQIEERPVATANYQPVKDKPIMGEGHVVIDLSHYNNLQINDLAPLRDRLQARGVTIETFDGGDDSLEASLHKATALIVIAPGQVYTASEREAIVTFVNDGGLLLLAADPTRPVSQGDIDDPYRSPYDALFPTSAVPAINSLANAFGVVYYDDYLYNLEDNADSYRNVKFTSFGENALVKGAETVVFFAAHSLRSDGMSLVVGDKDTLSPVRSGETDLAAAVLTGDQRVLALGDITFMLAPYHTVEDNDQFLSNIANWLAVDKRQRDDLEDFPYLFSRPVDLVQASGDTLDPRLIARAGAWQTSFEQIGLVLNLRAQANPEHDVTFVATFEDTETVDEYLDSYGVTVEVTPSEEKEKETGEEEEEESTEKDTGKVTGSIEIEGMGTAAIEGTTLFILDQSDERVAVVVVAEDIEKTVDGIGRLIDHDLSGCVRADAVMVCSTGEAPEEQEPADEEADGVSAAISILIIAIDDKATGSRSGAPELEAILGESYDVTVWYNSSDGIPTASDVAGYDVYIIDAGDYASDPTDLDIIGLLEEAEDVGIMLIGAQPIPIFTEFEPIYDIQVADSTHPLATGFETDEILTLSASESGVPAVIATEEDAEIGDEVTIVFRRGPDSPSSGAPVVAAGYDDAQSLRIVAAFFAFYQLPEDAQRTFALNAVSWLIGAEG